MCKIKNCILVLIIVFCVIASQLIVSAKETKLLSVEQAQDLAVSYSNIDNRLIWYEHDWEEQISNIKRSQDDIGKMIKADDTLRKIRKYLATEDYRSMRMDLKADEALDYLFVKGYITAYEYGMISYTNNIEAVLLFFNDDKVVKEYYEYMLLFYPGNYVSAEQRIDMIEVKDIGLQQYEAVIKQQRTALEGERDQLKVDTYKAYTDYIIALKSGDNALKNLQAAQRTCENYEKKYSLGIASKTELMDAQLQRDAAELDGEIAEKSMQSAEFALKSLIGMDMSQALNIDEELELPETGEISSVKLIENMEKDNINLFIYNETVVKPAAARFDIAQTETSKKSELYKDLEDEKNKAELEFAQMKNELKTAIISQTRGIKSTQRTIEDNERKLETMQRQKELLKLQVEQGLATDLDLMKLENGYNTLNNAIENMKYVKAYQWYMLQHTILY